ncbi:4-amino-4-deoxy-L-arabinose transferase [Aeromicrobium chenweiae]|uniref:4-amino-4-deoxy-L-arabinose transferase n=1 Tax=Aeromicrobium chenweiae TaxID=2079793 RepID=A0A2S0WK06_9ACTN|nr:4-amino-4-deoxy-L-arabinose transferase [Aeromicrobium chenweiae]AWB91679.1 4-amino-4-deoxy-L-arabinose transferase [Aeromicrobium chenweiae]TGN32519.1 4-amino-4-deoxy-L-arabinose transferase [Aeromicrobium chenweiae]
MALHRYDALVDLIADRMPACGSTKVVAVDGRSGSGKTAFTAGLVAATGAAVLHLDDIYPGWHGLAATPPMVAGVLASVAVGEVGVAPRWSWVRDEPASELRVPPAPLLVLDGVGSGATVLRPYLSLLIWLDAPADVRRSRALARDGDTFAPYWDIWAEQEETYLAADHPRQHADVVIPT